MASGNSPEKLGRSGVAGGHCMVVRTESLRAQSTRHRIDQPTISGRSCANSAHYKPLFACVDRTFVKSISSRRGPEGSKVHGLTTAAARLQETEHSLRTRGQNVPWAAKVAAGSKDHPMWAQRAVRACPGLQTSVLLSAAFRPS